MILCGKLPVHPGIQVINKGTERYNIVLQQYPIRYRLSDKRRATYYLATAKISKTLQRQIDAGDFIWKMKKKGDTVPMLFNPESGEFVIKNSKVAGTPRETPISGQDFWSGGMQQQWNRMKLKEQLMDYFIPRVRTQLPEQIWPPKGMFMQFEYIFFRNLDEFNITNKKIIQDLDNHSYPYMKVFKDTLQHLEVIKGDDPRYIRGGYPHYVHIDNDEERRMEVKIHFCSNDQAIQRPIYEYHDAEVPKQELLTDIL